MIGRICAAIIAALGGNRQNNNNNRRQYIVQQGPSTADENAEFEQQGKEIMMRRLNLALGDIVNDNLTPIWKNPRTGAVLYIGNHLVAEDATFLLNHNITAVVNCTRPGLNGKGELPNYHEFSPYNITYYNFPVARWRAIVNNPHNSITTVLDFFMDMFRFIENALNEGQSVLVHCLAGAHRAGTTGIATLMYFAELPKDEAIRNCQIMRPIVDPIGSLSECLTQLDICMTMQKMKSPRKDSSPPDGSESQSTGRKESEVEHGAGGKDAGSKGSKGSSSDKDSKSSNDGSKDKVKLIHQDEKTQESSPGGQGRGHWWLIPPKRVTPFGDVKDSKESRSSGSGNNSPATPQNQQGILIGKIIDGEKGNHSPSSGNGSSSNDNNVTNFSNHGGSVAGRGDSKPSSSIHSEPSAASGGSGAASILDQFRNFSTPVFGARVPRKDYPDNHPQNTILKTD